MNTTPSIIITIIITIIIISPLCLGMKAHHVYTAIIWQLSSVVMKAELESIMTSIIISLTRKPFTEHHSVGLEGVEGGEGGRGVKSTWCKTAPNQQGGR